MLGISRIVLVCMVVIDVILQIGMDVPMEKVMVLNLVVAFFTVAHEVVTLINKEK